jgi:hypothetical protein
MFISPTRGATFPLYASILLPIVPNLFFPSDAQSSSAVFSDVFARVESGFNHFRTVTHDHDARLAAISAVDKEVEATRQLLRSLLTRRNALAPISLLPPEILARVFHALALDEPPCDAKQSLGWIKTTHVCRHWRQVALGDSSLWARISGIDGSHLNTALISEMLSRARNAPLEIEINIMHAIPNPMHIFPPHLSHTRVLRLVSLQGSDCGGVRDIFNRKAPALEHLELDFAVGYPIVLRDFRGTKPFKGQAPKLRSFFISQVCVPWSSIPRGQLTQLKIILQADFFDDEGVPSLGTARQFIDLLVDCPALEILVLELCLPSDISESSQGRTVHLPRLSRLCVGGLTSSVTDLLKMLRIPSITTLHLRCVSNIVSPTNDYHILPAVSALFQTSVPVEFKSLQVTLSHESDSLDIAASTSPHPSTVPSSREIEVDMDVEAEFVLSFGGLAEFVHGKEILERACKMLPISNLEFLSINSPQLVQPASPINWAELFKRCTNVTTIQAIGRGTSGLIRALTPPNTKKGKKKKRDGSGTSAVPAPGTIIFPNLTSLLLESLDFTEIKSHSGIFYEVLANGLRQRASTYKVPIRKVCVDNCVIPAWRANALNKLVADLRWDGEEGLGDDIDELGEFDDDSSDFSESGARWQDFYIGSTQAEYDFWENYSNDGW